MLGLSKRTKIRPEELGIALADVLATNYFQEIVKHANEFRDIGNFTNSELETLQHLLLMIHWTAISVGVEKTDIDENNKKIILDSFWNSVSDELRENTSVHDLINPPWRHTNLAGNLVLANIHRFEKLFKKNFTGMNIRNFFHMSPNCGNRQFQHRTHRPVAIESKYAIDH